MYVVGGLTMLGVPFGTIGVERIGAGPIGPGVLTVGLGFGLNGKVGGLIASFGRTGCTFPPGGFGTIGTFGITFPDAGGNPPGLKTLPALDGTELLGVYP